jgi:hypothetical protein
MSAPRTGLISRLMGPRLRSPGSSEAGTPSVRGVSNFRCLFFEFAGVQDPGGQKGIRGILNRQA